MQSRTRICSLALLMAGAVVLVNSAQGALPNLGLTGTTQSDGWAGLTSANFPGYGSFPGTGAWPNPIGSNVATSGDADLNKIGLGSGGGAFAASEGIYHGGFSDVPNTLGGTESITDITPVSSLRNVVFQILISEAFGYDLTNDVRPVLNYNGGSQALLSNFASKTRVDTGTTFPNPISGVEEPLFHTTRVLQWDLSSVVDPITSFAVVFSPVQHSIILEARLDQSSTFTWVPEPASVGYLGLIGIGCLRRGNRRVQH